mmetsp:Transcript_62046/g.138239  ORF Transcript_62046/g.138239 Transcript_62046/m.138239 type:complete len:221 (-) Transcript_62046:585-1247(-)
MHSYSLSEHQSGVMPGCDGGHGASQARLHENPEPKAHAKAKRVVCVGGRGMCHTLSRGSQHSSMRLDSSLPAKVWRHPLLTVFHSFGSFWPVVAIGLYTDLLVCSGSGSAGADEKPDVTGRDVRRPPLLPLQRNAGECIDEVVAIAAHLGEICGHVMLELTSHRRYEAFWDPKHGVRRAPHAPLASAHYLFRNPICALTSAVPALCPRGMRAVIAALLEE